MKVIIGCDEGTVIMFSKNIGNNIIKGDFGVFESVPKLYSFI